MPNDTLGPNHPAIHDMQRAARAVAAAAAASAPRVSAGTPARLRVPRLQAIFGSQKSLVIAAARHWCRKPSACQADVAVLRDQYQKTAARAGELAQQSQALDIGLTLLGSATAPTNPIFPNWPVLIFGSLGLGLVIGILVAMLLELLGRRVRGVEDLQLDDVPVLGQMVPNPTVEHEAPLPAWKRLVPFRRDRAAAESWA